MTKPHRPAIREADIRRAIKAALAGGLRCGEFEVRADGESVRIVTYASESLAPPDEGPNPWDGSTV